MGWGGRVSDGDKEVSLVLHTLLCVPVTCPAPSVLSIGRSGQGFSGGLNKIKPIVIHRKGTILLTSHSSSRRWRAFLLSKEL